jgi:hypothetical protein
MVAKAIWVPLLIFCLGSTAEFENKSPISINKAVKGRLYLLPENPETTAEFSFQPKNEKDLGIKRDTADHRTRFFVYPAEPILRKLKIDSTNHPQGDYCWQWEATLLIEEFNYGFGKEGGIDEAKVKLVKATNLNKSCSWK